MLLLVYRRQYNMLFGVRGLLLLLTLAVFLCNIIYRKPYFTTFALKWYHYGPGNRQNISGCIGFNWTHAWHSCRGQSPEGSLVEWRAHSTRGRGKRLAVAWAIAMTKNAVKSHNLHIRVCCPTKWHHAIKTIAGIHIPALGQQGHRRITAQYT